MINSLKYTTKAVSVIEKLITPDMNDYEKELAVHDYIVGCASYDEAHLNALGIGLPNSDNPYGCLINGKAICSGYSTISAFLWICWKYPARPYTPQILRATIIHGT